MNKDIILVTGHKNPDTDSICSAISYAYLKTQLGEDAVGICAGQANKETQFVLDYFKVEHPTIYKDFYVKVRQVMDPIPAVSENATLEEINEWCTHHESHRIPVVSEADGSLIGLIMPPILARAALQALTSGEKHVVAKDLARNKEHLTIDSESPAHELIGKHCGQLAVLEGNRYIGMVKANPTMPENKQKVILVDHNESVQIIDGIEEAEIYENIDHHRIGGLTTENPIFIHYEPVGCTCTIVTGLYQLHGVDIPSHIAGLLMSAIISDTVLFRSPTCTKKDVEAVKYLASIAGVEYEKYGMEMLKAGADMSDFTTAQIVGNDMKEFSAGNEIVSIAQISVMDASNILTKQSELVAALEALRLEKGYTASYLMVTDILDESTHLLFSGDVHAVVEKAFSKDIHNNGVFLPHTMSRKKQIVPPILGAMK